MSRLALALATLSVVGILMPASAGAGPIAEHLIVRTYNTFGVAPHRMALARRAAEAILRDAAIAVVWRTCPVAGWTPEPSTRSSCDAAVEAQEVIVRLVGANARVGADWLGYSFVNVEARSGVLATVFADRVERLSDRLDIDAGTLLGRAIAHEIAHLLLGTSGHSPGGLMRADWGAARARPQVKGEWLLSRAEKARMLKRLAEARLPRVAIPAAERQARTVAEQHDVLTVER